MIQPLRGCDHNYNPQLRICGFSGAGDGEDFFLLMERMGAQGIEDLGDGVFVLRR